MREKVDKLTHDNQVLKQKLNEHKQLNTQLQVRGRHPHVLWLHMQMAAQQLHAPNYGCA